MCPFGLFLRVKDVYGGEKLFIAVSLGQRILLCLWLLQQLLGLDLVFIHDLPLGCYLLESQVDLRLFDQVKVLQQLGQVGKEEADGFPRVN
jgi:hypothetical protein